MSTETFLNAILDKFSKLTELLIEAADMKECVAGASKAVQQQDSTSTCSSSTGTTTDHRLVLNKTKILVEKLYELSNGVKEQFFDKYEEYVMKDDNFSSVASDNNNLIKKEDAADDNSENNAGEIVNKRPCIKLVDINKLVDKTSSISQQKSTKDKKKSVQFDTSVVIITSSDEDNANNYSETNNGKNNITKRLLQLNNESNNQNKWKSKKSLTQNNVIKSKKTATKERVVISSDEDDDSQREYFTGNRRTKEEMRKTRKNGKRRVQALTTGKMKTCLNESNSSSSSLSSGAENNDAIDSSDDDGRGLKSKQQGRRRRGGGSHEDIAAKIDLEKDPKFNGSPYVKLLKLPCDKLKEYYLEQNEYSEIKKLTNVASLKRSVRSRRSTIDGEKETANSSSSTASDLDLASVGGAAATKSTTVGRQFKKFKQTVDDVNNDEIATEAKTTATAEVTRKSLSPSSLNDDENDSTRIAAKVVDANVHEKEVTDHLAEELLPVGGTTNDEQLAELALDALQDDDDDDNNDMANDSGSDTTNKNTDEPSKKTNENNENHSIVVNEKDKINENDEMNNTSSIEKENNSENHKDSLPVTTNNNDDDDNATNGEMICENDKELVDNNSINNKKLSSKSNDDTDSTKVERNDKWRKDKLLTDEILLSSGDDDSDDDLIKFSKKNDKASDEDLASDDDVNLISYNKGKRKAKKRVKKPLLLDSDSDDEIDNKSNNKDNGNSGDDEEEADEEETVGKTLSSSEDETENNDENKSASRKRVKRIKDSSDEDDEKSTRKQIRRVLGRDSLSETTKQAEDEERKRKARISDKQKKYNQIFDVDVDINATVDRVVLDFDETTKKELVKIDDDLVKRLKPHQASGIKFMWDACFESLERAQNTSGSGCILAHCMGLGKTLQVIALSHTLLLNSEETKVRKVMVVCPLSTVLNWVNEYRQWLPDLEDFEVFELVSFKQNCERHYRIKQWHECGGVLIIGYDMFRNLSNPDNKRISKKMRAGFQEALIDPGPDLVVCDEGHLLKNEKTNLSIAMNRLKTLRRIVLTGTPLQNNLKEYFCMVQFIKPSLLGTYKEYLNRFVNPITNGQYTDSTLHDIQVMRRRSHVLHKLLDGIVQRRDYAVLQPYLPPKHEYVLFLTLTETQINLYQYYMDNFAQRSVDGSNRTSFLFVDFQELQRICTHPRVLLDKSIERRNAKDNRMTDSEEESEGSLKDFINDSDDASSSPGNSSSDDDDNSNDEKKRPPRKRLTRATATELKKNGGGDVEEEVQQTQPPKEWWQQFCDGDELDNINHSGKLFLLFEILKDCEQIGDKVLVFSQSLYSLNVIEYFLNKIDEATQLGQNDRVGGHTGSWSLGLDYFRLDGSSSCDSRTAWCKTFNNPKNTRARLFLISTKAGGLGINLVAANRVIIFDVSWNPSHDIQSIYRIYRFGQLKPSYVYRFVTHGTMEMKIYERQVTKQAISKRVIDEQQIDRHYNQNDLTELYKFDPRPEDRPIPLVPKDVLFAEMLQKYEDRIFRYHEHQSLLENKEDESLNEAERKAAWEEFESEKVQRSRLNTGPNTMLTPQTITIALRSIVKKSNPSWTELQINTVLPMLTKELQEQVSTGNLTMYAQLQNEIKMIQAQQNIKIREQYYQQQAMKMYQQQQQMAMNNPALMANFINNWQNMGGPGGGAGPSQQGPPGILSPTSSSDVINLID